ncbi:MAG: hypothetical protein EOP06_05865 [Proteobacteria bacterium]|nr:MAG: hypothetical protein EOP06_05865 [Pseudomonadota bacterium]
MIPIVEKIERFGDLVTFLTTDRVQGCAVKFQMIDIESEDAELKAERLSLWFRTLNPKVRARFILDVAPGADISSATPRAEAIRQLGYVEKKLVLVIEENKPIFSLIGIHGRSRVESFSTLANEALGILKDLGFTFSFATEREIESLFIADFSEWTKSIGSIETGSRSLGVVRLNKPSATPVSVTTLATLLLDIPAPYKVSLSVEKLGAAQTEIFLQRRLKQFNSEVSGVGSVKASSTEDVLIETSVSGEALLNYELLVCCERSDKSMLRDDLRKIAAALKGLGDVYIETVGTAESFVATLAGASPHVQMLERESVLPVFAPIFAVGETKVFAGEQNRCVSLHRRDRSIMHLDLLDPDHQNANALIVGSSGRGKSVLLGATTQSLLKSDSVRMIKVDVGGSHSRECSMNGGVEFKISIDRPSGLNPFSLVDDSAAGNEFVRSVLGQFLESLLREEGEIRLSKSLRAQIDDALNSYLHGFVGKRSLDTFFDFATTLPRRELLSRWCKTGLYANAFRGEADAQENRLRYFNFAEVFQAADPEFAQAAMAAVLATFNLEMRANPDKRLVLVCDETPFFIERCFEFFKFSAANVRKFGASLILVVQLSRHLVVNGDTGVVENCAHKFLLSADGPQKEYCSRLQLSENEFEMIEDLRFSSRAYSELLYKAGDEARTLRLALTPQEYWRLTSSQADRLKFDSLMAAVPNLKVDEAIKCLSGF